MKYRMLLIAALLLTGMGITPARHSKPKVTPTTKPIVTRVTPRATPTVTREPAVTPTATPSPVPTVVSGEPYPGAPLCVDHDHSVFHTLWGNGCHYDHEHGENPFTQAVAEAFPSLDLQALLGGVQIGHQNPSSPIENTDKHGGMKWQVQVNTPQGCAVGFEGGTVAIDALAIQYHAFGDPAIENESRFHSTVALLRQCQPGNPDDKGYVFISQLQDYGQRIVPYQGTVFGYPNQPVPAYRSGFGPYLSQDCVGPVVQCRSSLEVAQSNNNNTIWTSKVTGSGHSETPNLFRLLFRGRDVYKVIDWNDQVHPFTFYWLCTTDGGTTYNPAGCRYNNTTTRIHEISGYLPESWDNLSGWDTDPRVGRLTVEGYVDQYGQPAIVCEAPGVQCYPIKLVNAFVGFYSSEISTSKVSSPTPLTNPERDIYFCGEVVCGETSQGAVPSGWVGPNN